MHFAQVCPYCNKTVGYPKDDHQGRKMQAWHESRNTTCFEKAQTKKALE